MLRRLVSVAASAARMGEVQLSAQQTATPLTARPRWFATNSTDVFNVHMDSPDNNKSTSFDFTDKNYERVAELIAQYPPNYKASAIIPVLDIAQQQNGGWLSLAAMNRVAKVLDMAEIRVYEVATFYSMFNRSKVGKFYIQVCGTTPCRLNGAQDLVKGLEKHLGIHMGQTTPCGTFTLGEMECMGSCVNAPMMVVADYSKGSEGYSYNYYEDLTPDDACRIADTYKAGKLPDKVGSQYRSKAEPAGHTPRGAPWKKMDGGTTLQEAPPGPYCRDLDAATAPPPPPK